MANSERLNIPILTGSDPVTRETLHTNLVNALEANAASLADLAATKQYVDNINRHEWELVIEEPAAGGQTVPLTTRANGAGHLTRIAAACSAGSCSVKLQVGGVDVPDSSLIVGQEIGTAALDTGFADGDRVTVVISDVDECADLELTAHYRQV